MSTPAADGFSMPAEWAPHERTLVAWPAREPLWGRWTSSTRHVPPTATVRRDRRPLRTGDGRREPAVRATRPRGALAGVDGVDVVEEPLDDSWVRDTGPIDRDRPRGAAPGRRLRLQRLGRQKYVPFDADDGVGVRGSADALGLVRDGAPFVLEGGAITVDGAGTLVTTEQCLLHPNRNPSMSRADIEAALARLARASSGSSGWRRDWSRTATPTATSTTCSRSSRPASVCSRGRPTPRARTLRCWPTPAAASRPPASGDHGDRRPAGGERRRARRRRAPLNLYQCNGGGVIVPVAEADEVPPAPRWQRSRPRCPAARSSACPGRCWPTAAAGCTASPSRCRHEARVLTNLGAPLPSPARVEPPTRTPCASASCSNAGTPIPPSIAPPSPTASGSRPPRARQLVCLQELTLSPYFAVDPAGPGRDGARRAGRAGAAPRRPDARVRGRARARDTVSSVHASLYEAASDDDGLPLIVGATTPRSASRRLASCSPARASCTSRHRGLLRGPLVPTRASAGATPYPVVTSSRPVRRVPDVLGPVVSRAGARVLAGRCGNSRVPDRDRIRARPPRLRHRTAVGACDHRERHRERPAHGGRQPGRAWRAR